MTHQIARRSFRANVRFAALVSVSIPAVLLALAGIANAADAPKMNQPGRCVVVTEYRDSGEIVISKSCEYTHEEWLAKRKAESKSDKRTAR